MHNRCLEKNNKYVRGKANDAAFITYLVLLFQVPEGAWTEHRLRHECIFIMLLILLPLLIMFCDGEIVVAREPVYDVRLAVVSQQVGQLLAYICWALSLRTGARGQRRGQMAPDERWFRGTATYSCLLICQHYFVNNFKLLN